MSEQAPLYSDTVNWIGTTLSIAIVVIILIIFFLIIKSTTDDSDKHSEIKKYVEALFGGGSQASEKQKEEDEARALEAARKAKELGPFEDTCPACHVAVTDKHIDCPSCGLRLM
ncbi:hypothetical protein [Paenibacillus guangzhouensis]|uniref:hypothetical protein n=1 Tax=Paenibacillus guangzhouensis TaxID=1473112 RepID=UPI00126702D9|nr:hypothetical protein [Paenibacillus guangzhouensis]